MLFDSGQVTFVNVRQKETHRVGFDGRKSIPGSVVFDAFRGLWSRENTTITHRSDAKNQGNPRLREIKVPKR